MNGQVRLTGLSKSARYAILGAIHLAGAPKDRLVMSDDAATRLRLPPSFLAKLFQRLAHKGILVSQRGPRGGYALARPPEEVTLAEVVVATQDPVEGERDCVLEPRRCSSKGTCCIHSDVIASETRLIGALERITLAEALRSGKEAVHAA